MSYLRGGPLERFVMGSYSQAGAGGTVMSTGSVRIHCSVLLKRPRQDTRSRLLGIMAGKAEGPLHPLF